MSVWSEMGLERWQSEGPKWAFTTSEVEGWDLVMSAHSIPDAIEWLEEQAEAKGRKVCRHCQGSGEAPNPAFSCGKARCDGGWVKTTYNWRDLLEEKMAEAMTARYGMLEGLAVAFMSQTGIPPDQCELVQQDDPANRQVRYFYRRRGST